MPISVPKRRNAFVPIGKLRGGSYGKSGKHGAMANLNLTPMVDMFTTIVIFLIQLFSATGDILFAQAGIGAVFALLGTLETGLDAVVVDFVSH
jgi:hypothetical protein